MDIQKEIQKVQLDLILKLDEVCRNNGLKYFLACGTCIGAVRHGGFIPWDDDIDVFMKIGDVEKLLRLKDEFKNEYFLQSKETDKHYGSISLRLRNSNTTYIEKDDADLDINHGIYMDIYPLYYAPESRVGLKANILLSHIYKILVGGPPKNHGALCKYISIAILKMIPPKKRNVVIGKIENRLRKPVGTPYVLTYFGKDIFLFNAIIYSSEWFETPKEVDFEGYTLWAPTEPEKYLQCRYGDFMKLPPKEEQVYHHSCIVVDPFKSYTEYK